MAESFSTLAVFWGHYGTSCQPEAALPLPWTYESSQRGTGQQPRTWRSHTEHAGSSSSRTKGGSVRARGHHIRSRPCLAGRILCSLARKPPRQPSTSSNPPTRHAGSVRLQIRRTAQRGPRCRSNWGSALSQCHTISSPQIPSHWAMRSRLSCQRPYAELSACAYCRTCAMSPSLS